MSKFPIDNAINEEMLRRLSRAFPPEIVDKHKRYILDVMNHKQAYLAVSAELGLELSKQDCLHDFDKILIALTAGEFIADSIHEAKSMHHINQIYSSKSKDELLSMIINLECSHLTKKGISMNAYGLIETLYPKHFGSFEVMLETLGICKPKKMKYTFSKWNSQLISYRNSMIMMCENAIDGFLDNVDEYGLDEAIQALYEDRNFLPF